MTWTIDKTIEFGKLQRRLRNAGRTIAVFDPRATDLECEVVRGALETIDRLQQREARLQEVEVELADKVESIKDLRETIEYQSKGNTNA